jgi:hypothetical protein
LAHVRVVGELCSILSNIFLGGWREVYLFFFLVNKQRWCLYLLLCQCWLRAYICVDGLGRACAPHFFTKKYFGSCRKSNWLGMIPVESRPVLIWDFFFLTGGGNVWENDCIIGKDCACRNFGIDGLCCCYNMFYPCIKRFLILIFQRFGESEPV